ncbi:MAG: carbon storage regulator CsrA [Thermincola sp.]|nr:carbon storage regulator CsrA [Thermincola sp.]MDT3703384.1 carbon storage regulator CsrA [Thermincola sp.]
MLVLTRKRNESIIIDNQVEVIILEVIGDQVKIGIKAPKEIPVLRKEIYQAVKDENKAAIKVGPSDINELAEIIKKRLKKG